MKLEIKKYFKYKESRVSDTKFEFGWSLTEEIKSGKLVVATSTDLRDWDNAALISDYEKYFSKLTRSTATKFLERWKHSPKEYSLYWYNHLPNSEVGSHEFFLKLAELICNKTPFEHLFSKGLVKYQVVDVSEPKGSSSRD